MKIIRLLTIVLCMCFYDLCGIYCFAESVDVQAFTEKIDERIDILSYFDMTYDEVLSQRLGLFKSIDTFGSGKEFLTDGRIAFYFEFDYDNNLHDSKVNRIVITSNDTGRLYLGDNMCICATYNDEVIYMESNGFENVCTLGDLRKVWMNDEYVAIVSRGPYVGCCEIDISKNAEGLY